MAEPGPGSERLAALRRRLEAIVGADAVSQQDDERLAHAVDCWPLAVLRRRAGRWRGPLPDLVVWPHRGAQVAAVLEACADHGVPVVPYGGGSGVCGGVVPVRGGVALDLKRLDRIRGLRETALLCEVEAGVIGSHLEAWLGERGYTLGHFPSSIACSTVGGWIAARSSGQASTRYGSIEHLVAGLEVVLPTGELAVLRPVPRTAAGIDWRNVLCGSEGLFGVVTRAWLRVQPVPAARRFLAFRFPDFDAGLDAMRRVLRRGYRPAVMRLYDPLDTLVGVSGGGGGGAIAQLGRAAFERARALLLAHPRWAWLAERAAGGCHAVVVCEGEAPLVALEAEVVHEEARRGQALDAGPGPARRWFEHRYAISFKASPVFAAGGFVDTLEVAAPWDRIGEVYRAVREAIAAHAVTLAHASHLYPDGCSVYFTFAAATGSVEQDEACYEQVWRAGLAAAREHGATISHHHGVGLLKAQALREELGPLHAALGRVKAALDPHGVLNPGKLGL